MTRNPPSCAGVGCDGNDSRTELSRRKVSRRGARVCGSSSEHKLTILHHRGVLDGERALSTAGQHSSFHERLMRCATTDGEARRTRIMHRTRLLTSESCVTLPLNSFTQDRDGDALTVPDARAGRAEMQPSGKRLIEVAPFETLRSHDRIARIFGSVIAASSSPRKRRNLSGMTRGQSFAEQCPFNLLVKTPARRSRRRPSRMSPEV